MEVLNRQQPSIQTAIHAPVHAIDQRSGHQLNEGPDSQWWRQLQKPEQLLLHQWEPEQRRSRSGDQGSDH